MWNGLLYDFLKGTKLQVVSPQLIIDPTPRMMTTDFAGNEKFTLHVKDLSTGRQLLSKPIEVRAWH